MNQYDGFWADRYHGEIRYARPTRNPVTIGRLTAAQRDIAAPARVPGDISAEEIDRRFYAALRFIRWLHARSA